MSELLVTAIKVLFLALLWFFILFAANVIRTDMFGRTVTTTELDEPAPLPRRERSVRSRRRTSLPRTLRISEGRQAGITVPLSEELLIGRGPDCQLLLDDDYASTHHARLTRSETGWTIHDEGSTNGTYVNGVRITAPTAITRSDSIRIGRTTMNVEP